MPARKLNEDQEFTIPLKNLIWLISATAIGVWLYFGTIERLTMLESNQERLTAYSEQSREWIQNFETPPEVKETVERVRELELKLIELQTRIQYQEDSK